MTEAAVDWIGRAQKLEHRVENIIDGKRKAPGGAGSIDKHGPRDGNLICRFRDGDLRDVEEAVKSARRAFSDRRWSGLAPQRRKAILQRLAGLVEEHCEELALLECLDVGKPIADALTIDVPMAMGLLRFNAEAADKIGAHVFHADASNLSYQLKRPIGVIGGIVGWNFPLVLAAAKVGPVLATGNSLVLKPSEFTSFSASRLAELALEAGVPAGVLNVVHGGAPIGAALAEHNDVDCVTFTGSTATGKKLLVAAGQSNMKRLVLECGGKAANIVFEDCPNLDTVADAVVQRAFWNQGQVCTASSRLLVEASIKDELLKRVIERTAQLRLGDPLNAGTRFGALVSREHVTKVMRYVRGAPSEGARLVHQTDGAPPFEGGFYVAPMIFDAVSPEQRIAREEVFGPVLSVLSFGDEAAAIRIANDTIYGLSAVLWTRDMGRAHRIAFGLDVGWTVVNASARPTGGPATGVISTGGHKQSGIGVEGGFEGLDDYLTKTAVQLFVGHAGEPPKASPAHAALSAASEKNDQAA